jgi:4-amino-4-deoxy-L-arabinose transferase-like glycosyltransferase
MQKAHITTSLGLFVILFFTTVYRYSIFTDGMFFDGICYAAVANNLANGVGTFWEMEYTSTLHNPYHEQPPLALFLQSLLFRVLGDSIFVERLYCLLFSVLTLIMLIQLWRSQIEEKKHSWLPVLLWVIILLNIWTYQNNLIEVTMGFLDLCAVYFVLKSCRHSNFWWMIPAGVFTFFAFFSKGFQGLFPLAAPLLYWISFRSFSFSKALLYALTMFVVTCICLGAVLIDPAARHFFELYLERRLGGTFNHLQDTTSSHLYLLSKLLLELLVPIGLSIVFWVLAFRQKKRFHLEIKPVLFFFAIGLSASLPLMITLEQRPFYLATSLPYYVLAIGLITYPSVDTIIDHLKNKNLTILNYVLAGLIVVSCIAVTMQAGKPKREHALLEDLALLRKVIPERTIVSISPDMQTSWSYHAYFMRYNSLSLDSQNNHPFYVRSKESPAPANKCYVQMELPLKKFVLYKCELEGTMGQD